MRVSNLMNIVILIFTCFCLIYSIGVIAYLILKKKKQRLAANQTHVSETCSVHNNQSVSLSSAFSNRRKIDKNSLKSFRKSEAFKSKKVNRGSQHKDLKSWRESQKHQSKHLGFSNIHLSKTINHINGILKNDIQNHKGKINSN